MIGFIFLLIILPSPILFWHRLRLLQLVHDEEVSGEGHVGRVAESTLPALVWRPIGFMLRNVFMKLEKIFCCKATNSTLVNFKNIYLELLQWLSDCTSWRPELQYRFFQFTLWTRNLKKARNGRYNVSINMRFFSELFPTCKLQKLSLGRFPYNFDKYKIWNNTGKYMLYMLEKQGFSLL